MTITQQISIYEQQYQDSVQRVFDAILSRPSTRLILVAGPSCSGKTTTTCNLVKLLAKNGITSHMISIDDFYRDVVTPDGGKFGGNADFESLDSIDLDCLHGTLKSLADGKQTDIPMFCFEKGKRVGIRNTVKLENNDIAIIEGLHALNPAIYENFVNGGKIFRLFLDCTDPSDKSGGKKLSRLVRRLVRDYNFRNSDAQKTLYLWQNVVRGEEKYIFPFAPLANQSVNTFFGYETALLKNDALKILSDLPKDGEYASDAAKITEYLNTETNSIDASLVPENSMLREFIG